MAIDNDSDMLTNIAIGNRIATLEGKEFTKQMNILRKPPVDHEQNLKRFGKK